MKETLLVAIIRAFNAPYLYTYSRMAHSGFVVVHKEVMQQHPHVQTCQVVNDNSVKSVSTSVQHLLTCVVSYVPIFLLHVTE